MKKYKISTPDAGEYKEIIFEVDDMNIIQNQIYAGKLPTSNL